MKESLHNPNLNGFVRQVIKHAAKTKLVKFIIILINDCKIYLFKINWNKFNLFFPFFLFRFFYILEINTMLMIKVTENNKAVIQKV